MNHPLLSVRSVTRTYDQRRSRSRRSTSVPAVQDVSLTVGRSEVLGLVGESGAGKSTLTRLVFGLEQPDQGQVLLDGQDLAELSPAQLRAARRRMHLILQDPYQSLHPGMRVGQSVAEPLAIARVRRAERAERVHSAMEEAGLAPAASLVQQFPHELSGGQRQRVALARALVGRPELVVADEPTSMLDASLRYEILSLINAIRAAHGTAFIVVTHDLALVRHVADRIAVLQQGRLVECGDTEQVVHQPSHPYTRALLAASASVR